MHLFQRNVLIFRLEALTKSCLLPSEYFTIILYSSQVSMDARLRVTTEDFNFAWHWHSLYDNRKAPLLQYLYLVFPLSDNCFQLIQF